MKHPVLGSVELVSRDVLERVANIIGENSGAYQALKVADSHDGPVNFYRRVNDEAWIVEKLLKPPDNV